MIILYGMRQCIVRRQDDGNCANLQRITLKTKPIKKLKFVFRSIFFCSLVVETIFKTSYGNAQF